MKQCDVWINVTNRTEEHAKSSIKRWRFTRYVKILALVSVFYIVYSFFQRALAQDRIGAVWLGYIIYGRPDNNLLPSAPENQDVRGCK